MSELGEGRSSDEGSLGFGLSLWLSLHLSIELGVELSLRDLRPVNVVECEKEVFRFLLLE